MSMSTTSMTAAVARRGRTILLMLLVIVLAVAAALGAYLDWLMWPIYKGLLITIAAGVILMVGAVVALAGHGIPRRIGLLILAVGVGLVVGQNLGPSREPLVHQFGGSMTLRLESPVMATATGPADCTNVASATEFQVSGDSNMRLDTPDRPFVMVYLNIGDRWAAIEDAPRKNGVRLEVIGNEALVPVDGKPAFIGMQATESSIIEASFSNEGGSIRFAGLTPKTGSDYSGEALDLAGTIEWTCGIAADQPEG